MKLAALADSIAKRLGDIRKEDGWEERLWDEIGWHSLDWKQCDIVFGMIEARWNRLAKAEAV